MISVVGAGSGRGQCVTFSLQDGEHVEKRGPFLQIQRHTMLGGTLVPRLQSVGEVEAANVDARKSVGYGDVDSTSDVRTIFHRSGLAIELARFTIDFLCECSQMRPAEIHTTT